MSKILSSEQWPDQHVVLAIKLSSTKTEKERKIEYVKLLAIHVDEARAQIEELSVILFVISGRNEPENEVANECGSYLCANTKGYFIVE